eukprot:c13077_g1_i2.p1 GENE.c13077_g1_i2~~c13077_g1_i2.p1  ORF type:complete len:185 (+),score=50.70 c13077_g1_i2:178-732(+)
MASIETTTTTTTTPPTSRKRPRNQNSKARRRNKKKNLAAEDEATTTTIPNHNHKLPFSIECCVAPMVGCSDLAFRLLCRKYGATCVWTEMFCSVEFATNEQYRTTKLQQHANDHPLIVQFSGNDPEIIVKAALLAQPHCEGIDINLGCPQRHARVGMFGAYLLDRERWPIVTAMVTFKSHIAHS